MEKTLTRLKSNLKSRRKLSLPMLVGQFHQHWNGTNSSESQQLAANGPKSAESEELLSESADVMAPACGSSPEDVDCSDDESALGDLSARSPMGKAWLSFGRSRRVKSRNKPRRWPSTPAFLPTSSRSGTTLGSTGELAEPVVAIAQPLPSLPTPLSAIANGHGGSSHNLTTKTPTVRPQPYIQGYHLTLPSFLSNRGRQQQQQLNGNHSQKHRQLQQEMASGRQNDVYHRVMESDDDDSADGDANVATSLTTVVVAAPQAPSTAKRTISSPLPMDVPAARSGEDGSSSSNGANHHRHAPPPSPSPPPLPPQRNPSRMNDSSLLLNKQESPIVPEDQVPRVNPPAHKTHPDGIGHQVISKGSLALAVSLPSINNFHSDAELEELRPSEEEISGLRSNSPKRPEQQRRVTKLKRRKAYYRHKKDGRSKSLTHIDTLDPGMLVSRENSGDSRSEPDSTMQLAGGSQDRLTVPAMATAALSSPIVSTVVALTSPAPINSSALTTEEHSSSDPAVRRRRLSNLYKITSSEYFSVSFDCLEEPGQEEFVAASKGTSLREALAAVCMRRGVDLSNVNVYLDSSKTPLSLITTETFWLGGKHLRIKAKDGVKSPVRNVVSKPLLQHQSSRKSSGSNRSGKTSRALSGATSTEDPTALGADCTTHPVSGNLPISMANLASSGSHEGSLKGKGAKATTRWSGLFGSTYKDTKMDLLADQLNDYSRHGIPRLPHLLTFEADEDTEEALYSLEEDWKLIVMDWTSLPERQRQQQNAIWELVQTEVAYLRTLKVITDLFMACLCNLQAAQILNEIDTERLFSNLPEIYVANRQFWAEHVFPMLKNARSARAPLDPTSLREGFLKFDELFHPYTKYCLDQSQCQQYCKEKDHDNELFKAYLAWCETQRDCNRLRLMDILVKPMQRLTKYSLLLKAVHKKTDAEEHKPVVVEMIQSVESFVGQVNSALRQRHEQERLREILSRIESYDVVEAKDEEVERLVKSHCDLDLTKPMPYCSENQRRYLLIEGDLKLRDQGTSKMDVHCFLFTDVLLICKPVARKAEKVKVIRPPCLVDRLVVIELTRDPAGLGLVYLNELGTASAAFSLHASEPKQSKVWLDHLRKSQELYRDAKATAAAAAVHPDPSLYYDEDDDLDYPHSALLVARSPRGSSRGSRGSSLINSHRISPSLPFLTAENDELNVAVGSVDMNDLANANRGNLVDSLEIKRTSSASSEESGPHAPPAAVKQIPSPRTDRRSIVGRSLHHSMSPVPTPNTLTVQVPHVKAVSNQGQSLPNLLSIAVPVPVTPASGTTSGMGSSLNVSGRVHSPSALNQRGVSYPPPSPRGLTRTQPVPQSRNPPLVKTRRLASVAGLVNVNVTDPSNQHLATCEAINPNVELRTFTNGVAATTPEIVTESFDLNEVGAELEDELVDPEYDDHRQVLNAALAKRLSRNERLDHRRYHTAGAIEDIKKQDAKNNSIHKRLSWNYGQQANQTVSPSSSLSTSRLLRSGLMGSATNSDSMLSFSSSGVSSTGSLHLSTASEVEDVLELEPDVNYKMHISSTYICNSELPKTEGTHVQVRPFQDKQSHNILHSSRAAPPPPPPRSLPVPASLPLSGDLRLDVSEVCDGISSVQITVSGAECCSSPNATSPTVNGKPSRADLIRMKDLIMGDTSMEASEV
uniref:Pleckstrin domain-containing family G member n=1 Tax=Daphnia magna TaxID=35525 RepID=A0A0N8CD92_9CRUS